MITMDDVSDLKEISIKADDFQIDKIIEMFAMEKAKRTKMAINEALKCQ